MKEALFAQPKGTAWLVATGPLTNIALLFAVFPNLAEHIAGLSIMGGAIGSDFTNVSVSLLLLTFSAATEMTLYLETHDHRQTRTL